MELGGIKQVPYRLPQLLKANDEKKEVFLVEGEKDADSLNSMGYCSTTCPAVRENGGNHIKDFSQNQI